MNLPNLNDARRRTKGKVEILDNYKITLEQKSLGLNKKYFVKTYGCQMNEHDSENIKAILEDIIDRSTDSLRFYNLGDKYKNKVEHIGKSPSFDISETLIF